MKKVTLLGLVLILLAVSVVPVMAKGGPPNGHGNGVGTGQGNNGGNHGQGGDQTQERQQERDSNPGSHGNGSNNRARRPFYLQGTISAIDTTAKTITVTVFHGNAPIKQYIGEDLMLYTDDSTLIFELTQGGDSEGEGSQTGTTTTSNDSSTGGSPSNRVPIKFKNLEVGQKVAIHGNLVAGVEEPVYTARLITVYIRADVGEPDSDQP
jgi:hypothetical protein